MGDKLSANALSTGHSLFESVVLGYVHQLYSCKVVVHAQITLPCPQCVMLLLLIH